MMFCLFLMQQRNQFFKSAEIKKMHEFWYFL